ncbi:uncharacterized protein LOC134252591 [Saccostrea cucullata]|uniref:uncharacterized protein LOC134252591 n=1 Tax=Saccostrea cuccullata TaxID=36930 RepID=UPI002ED0A974
MQLVALFILGDIVLFSCFTTGLFGRCSGPLICCRGYEYEAKKDICLRCDYPMFGIGCREKCNCSKENCNVFDGCMLHLTKETEDTASTTNIKLSWMTSHVTTQTHETIRRTIQSYKSIQGTISLHVLLNIDILLSIV